MSAGAYSLGNKEWNLAFLLVECNLAPCLIENKAYTLVEQVKFSAELRKRNRAR